MALILTRRPGEVINIGDNVTVKVVSVDGSQVRIAVEAPRSVIVDREEIAIRRARDAVVHP